MRDFKNIKVAVAGTGYVGLSIATLLAQHHHVTAVDVIPEKVEKLNRRVSPIQDDYIEKYLGDRSLLTCVGPDALHFWMPAFITDRLSKGFQQFGKSSHGFLTNE